MTEKKVKVCLTGNETTKEELAKRLALDADMQEIRADFLGESELNEAFWEMAASRRENLVFSCRTASRGGKFDGSKKTLADYYNKAAEAGVAYIDIEHDLVAQLRPAFLGKTKIIASYHSEKLKKSEALKAVGKINKMDVFAAKAAIGTNSLSDVLFVGSLKLNRPENCLLCMGYSGIISRIRPSSFNSDWIYAVTDKSKITVKGQLTLQELDDYRFYEHFKLKPVALIGGENTLESPGLVVYNYLFKNMWLPYQYIPLPTNDLNDLFKAFERFGIELASVTMPYKRDIVKLCNSLAVVAKDSGVANTICIKNSNIRFGCNTDSLAFSSLFNKLNFNTSTSALIIGSGATCWSALHALKRYNCNISILSRNVKKANKELLKSGVKAVAYQSASDLNCNVIINTAPVEAQNEIVLKLGDALNKADIIIDVGLYRRDDTPLIKYAKSTNKLFVDGLTFWKTQGALQMSLFTDVELAEETVENAIKKVWL